MARLGMIIDLQRCTGCNACVVACKQENEIAPGSSRIQVRRIGPFGQYPDLRGCFLPRLCQHCEQAACIDACPTGASLRTEAGIVRIDPEICTLCQDCILACPYDARSYNLQAGRIETCDFCLHRLQAGQEPACVQHCIAQAFIFGDLEDPDSPAARYLAANRQRVVHLPEWPGDPTGVIYLAPAGGMPQQLMGLSQK